MIVREPTPADIEALAAAMSERDREFLAKAGLEPAAAIRAAMAVSAESWVLLIDLRPVCFLNVDQVSALGGARVGFFATAEIDLHLTVIARHSTRVARYLRQKYGRIYGVCRADFGRSLRWLAWLGFSLKDAGEVFGTPIVAFESGGT